MVSDSQDQFTPTIESHLRQRHLAEGETPPSDIERHLRQIHMAEGEHTLQPTVEQYLAADGMAAKGDYGVSAGGLLPVASENRAEAAAVAATVGGRTGLAAVDARERIRLPLRALGKTRLREAIVLSEILQPPLALRHQ